MPVRRQVGGQVGVGLPVGLHLPCSSAVGGGRLVGPEEAQERGEEAWRRRASVSRLHAGQWKPTGNQNKKKEPRQSHKSALDTKVCIQFAQHRQKINISPYVWIFLRAGSHVILEN